MLRCLCINITLNNTYSVLHLKAIENIMILKTELMYVITILLLNSN